MAYFEIVGPVTAIQTIAVGRSIRQISRLHEQYGRGRWRKLKVRLKIKRFMD